MFANTTSKYCEKCTASNCTICNSTSPDKCLTCSATTVLYNSKCVTSCPSTTYNKSNVCNSCYSLCAVCTGPSMAECSKCVSYKYY